MKNGKSCPSNYDVMSVVKDRSNKPVERADKKRKSKKRPTKYISDSKSSDKNGSYYDSMS
jgi:hypothetical protein